MLKKLLAEIGQKADKEKAKNSNSFFKTGKGEYGEGDHFVGITVPIQREIARKYTKLSLNEVETLLQSKIHEHRLIALFILVDQFKHGDDLSKETIIQTYLKNKSCVNNWDLVDSSAPYLLGFYLLDKNRKILYKLADSKSIWDRRISILSTFAFIKAFQFDDAIKLAEVLLQDKHDLIQKAVGWMLREIGNRNIEVEIDFLEKHHKTMPRTMLRYAIEKFDDKSRKKYLS